MFAWEEPGLRAIADYFNTTGLAGNATGFMRMLPLSDVYTGEVQAKLTAILHLSWPSLIDGSMYWDEWGICFA
jgi:hypothetical protein